LGVFGLDADLALDRHRTIAALAMGCNTNAGLARVTAPPQLRDFLDSSARNLSEATGRHRLIHVNALRPRNAKDVAA